MSSRKTGSAVCALGALILFIAIVYANPGNWFDGTDTIPFAKIAAAFALVALGCSCLLYNRSLRIGGGIGLMLTALFALVGLSAAWSFWPSLTVDAFLDGLKYLAIFFLIVNVVDSRDRLARIVQTVAWVTLIPAIGAIVSHARGQYLVEGDRASWIGIFGNPNDLAYHMVVGIALTMAAREAAQTRTMRLVYLAMLIPMGLTILLTQSRGGMISAGVVVALWVARSLKHAPAVIGLVVSVGCILYLAPRDPWKARSETSVAFGEDVSAAGRVDAWRTGLNMLAERPLTGVGSGAFMVAWPTFAPGDVGPARTEHNTFIQMASELGIPGLALFLAAFIAGALGLSRATKVPQLKPYARGIQCGLAGFAVCSLSGGLAFTWPLYLLLGVSAATSRLVEPQRQMVKPLRSPAPLSAVRAA